MFEEGNAFTMEAVQQQLDDLAGKHEAQVCIIPANEGSALCAARISCFIAKAFWRRFSVSTACGTTRCPHPYRQAHP